MTLSRPYTGSSTGSYHTNTEYVYTEYVYTYTGDLTSGGPHIYIYFGLCRSLFRCMALYANIVSQVTFWRPPIGTYEANSLLKAAEEGHGVPLELDVRPGNCKQFHENDSAKPWKKRGSFHSFSGKSGGKHVNFLGLSSVCSRFSR